MIDAWEPENYKDPPNSLANSQTSLISSGTRSLFGRSKGRVHPALMTEETDDATNSIASGRGTPDVFVSDTGVAVEKATGETINEPQEDASDTTAVAIEIPHSVEHQPYIPLVSAQDALARVCLASNENTIVIILCTGG